MMNSTTKCAARALLSASLLLMTSIAVSAADWRLAVPTAEGLGLVDPQADSSSAVQIIGSEFGEIDEVVPLGINLMGSMSPVGTSNESILNIDLRSLAPTGTGAIGNGTFGLIPNQTITAPDGKSIYLATFDGLIQQIDLNNGKVLAKAEIDGIPFGLYRRTTGAETPVAAVKTETDTGYALSIVTLKEEPLAVAKKIALGEEKYGEEEIEYQFHVAGKTAFVFAPDHAYVADLDTSKVKRVKPVYNKKALTGIGSTTDGKYMICRIGDGATGFFVYDIAANTVVKRILMKGAAYAVGSSDGSSFYVSSPDKSTIGMFDAVDLIPTRSFIVRDLLGPIKILPEPSVSDSTPIPQGIGRNIVVYCDSFLGGSETSSFASNLSKSLKADGYGIPVINSANSDTEAADFISGYADSVTYYNPKIVVISLGQIELTMAADEASEAEEAQAAAALAAAQAEAAKTVKEALAATVQEALDAGLKVIVINPVNDGYKAVYEEVAKAASVTFIEGAKSVSDNAKKAYPVIVDMIKGMVQ